MRWSGVRSGEAQAAAGDKMAGRHGNKGVHLKILTAENAVIADGHATYRYRAPTPLCAGRAE